MDRDMRVPTTHREPAPLVRRRAYGFTLIELLTVLAVIAISLTLAVPSFSSVVANQSVRTVAWNLYTTMVLARNEAIKRNKTVTLSPKGDGWEAGWTITDSADVTIADFGPVNKVDVKGPGSVLFGRSGRPTWSDGEPPFEISAAEIASIDERCLGLDLSGRPYLEKKPSCSP